MFSALYSVKEVKFSPAFFKRRRGQGRGALVALRRERNPPLAFLFVNFFFAQTSLREVASLLRKRCLLTAKKKWGSKFNLNKETAKKTFLGKSFP